MQTVKDRIRAFADYKNISQSAFERACGFSHGYVSNMRQGPSRQARSLIAQRFPELDMHWLLSGEGTMLREAFRPLPVPEDERNRYMEMISARDQRILSLETTILELQRELDKYRNRPQDTVEIGRK